MEWLVLLIVFALIGVWFYLTEKSRQLNKVKSEKVAEEEVQEKTKKTTPKSPTGEGCVFCGGRPLSKQHIWPDWLRQVLPRIGEKNEHIRYGHKRLDDHFDKYDQTKISSGHQASRKLRIVCEGCNNGWMNVVESKARPSLTSLIKNESVIIDQVNQVKLASWAVLATIIYEYRDLSTKATPDADRHTFYKTKQPLKGWKVWVARNGDKAMGDYVIYHRGVLMGQKDRIFTYSCNNQITFFGVGSLLIVTVKVDDSINDFNFIGPLSEKLIQIFPLVNPQIEWSKLPYVNGKESESLLDLYIESLRISAM